MSRLATLRRAALAAVICTCCNAVHAHGDEAAAAARLPLRVALLQRAQEELERGDAAQALDDFERAAMMLHAADAELGLIRAAMQDGQYRRALAFCAHTAGEHTDDADGAALYAWLLRVGGQGELAARVLAQALASAPHDEVSAAVEAALRDPVPPVASGVLMQPLHRMAPWPSAPRVPAAARFVSNGVLVDDGTAALAPLPAVARAMPARAWVRNGLGQASEVELELGDATLAARGLARLKLRRALPVGTSRQAAGRAPFAGSPGFALQFGDASAPAWPQLTQGFLGTLVGDSDVRKVGFTATPGAAVLDAHGALVGIALAGGDGTPTWMPLSSAPAAPSVAAGPRPGAGFALTAPDEIYEAGLRRVLQVLVEDPR